MSVPRRYANPPIVEVVCEFRLTPSSPWDLTVPGLFYERVKDEFATREQRLVTEWEITWSPEGSQQKTRTSERLFFYAPNRNLFLQLGPRLLAVHCLPPYPTWAGFKPKIERAFEALQQTVGAMELERIGLRYINRIQLPEPVEALSEYFHFYLAIGEWLPQDWAAISAAAEFVYQGGRDRCRVQLLTDPTNRSIVFLDIDYFLGKPKEIAPQNALEWVEEAHSRVEEIFEGCITDRLRKLFEEVPERT